VEKFSVEENQWYLIGERDIENFQFAKIKDKLTEEIKLFSCLNQKPGVYRGNKKNQENLNTEFFEFCKEDFDWNKTNLLENNKSISFLFNFFYFNTLF